MRRVVFVTVVLLGLLGVAAGCARAPAGPRPPPRSSDPPPSDRAEIYSAMLLRFVAHSGEGVGSGAPTAVYVLDTAASDAGPYQAMAGQPAHYPIPAGDQAAILAVMREKSRIPVSVRGRRGTVTVRVGCSVLDAKGTERTW